MRLDSPPGVMSLRDPDGVLVAAEERLFRVLHPDAAPSFRKTLSNEKIAAAMARGEIAGTRLSRADETPAAVRAIAPDADIYEHRRIDFVSYPGEWSPLMLCDAAAHTLRMLALALDAGLILKDASPTNIVFDGARPVFVDLPSFVPRSTGTFLWHARHQFDACFVLPLLLHLEIGVPIAWSLRNPVQGVAHAMAARLLGPRAWLKPSLVAAVAVPAALSKRQGGESSRPRQDLNDERARFALRRQLAGLERRVARLREKVRGRSSLWRAYTASRGHYGAQDMDAKRRIVAEMIATVAPAGVLDIGANTGEFSAMGAMHAPVIALDVDEQSVNDIYERAAAERLPISPLVGNFARPTPAEGWDNAESRALLERLAGRCDLVLMLAVMHHLRVTEGIPMARILATMARVTRRYLLIEHVGPDDSMFRVLARGRDTLYRDSERAEFERLAAEYFTVVRSEDLSNGRRLYLLERLDLGQAVATSPVPVAGP